MVLKNCRKRHERLLKPIIKELIYGGHLLSLGATGIVSSGILLYGKSTDITSLLVLAYLTSQIVYNCDHLRDISNLTNNSERSNYLKNTYKYQAISIIMYTLLFLITAFLINLSTWLLATFITLGGIMYSLKTKHWTKKLIGFKNWYIAFYWSLLIFLIPLHYSEPVFTRLTLTLSLYVFVRWLINSIVFDIKDVKNDKVDRLLTFPVVWGVNRTIQILHLLNIFSSSILLIGFILAVIPDFALILNIFTLYSFYYLYKINNLNEKQIRLISYTMVDGEYLIWPIVLIFANKIF